MNVVLSYSTRCHEYTLSDRLSDCYSVCTADQSHAFFVTHASNVTSLCQHFSYVKDTNYAGFLHVIFMSRLFSQPPLCPDMILGPLFPDTLNAISSSCITYHFKPLFFIKYTEVALFYMYQITERSEEMQARRFY